MNRKLATLTVGCVLVLALAGCKPPAPVELTLADSGKTVTLEPQQEMVVTLESNPTTGYKWEREGNLPEPLIGGNPEYVADSASAGLAGGGGAEIWRFQADSKGEGTLKLKYWRSFEPTVPPVKTFEVTVKVGVK